MTGKYAQVTGLSCQFQAQSLWAPSRSASLCSFVSQLPPDLPEAYPEAANTEMNRDHNSIGQPCLNVFFFPVVRRAEKDTGITVFANMIDPSCFPVVTHDADKNRPLPSRCPEGLDICL